jgi:outer membrane protein OmpA-like peptidoglycan-associated protein
MELSMRNRVTFLIGIILSTTYSIQAQQNANPPANPIINIHVSRSIETVNYWSRGSTKVDLIGTALMPRAEGSAKIEAQKGALAIDADFKELQPPSTMGSPYLVFVLWAITPEGRANNLGQLIIKDRKSHMSVTTKLQTFGMIVTAEPYFAVGFPSDEVVMENQIRKDTKGAVAPVDAKFELLKRGVYDGAQLEPMPANSKVPLDLLQARNAVRIAKFEGADKYAAESFTKAQQALAQAEDYETRKQKNAVPTAARNAVQAAEDARAIAVRRQEDEAQAQKIAAQQQAAQAAQQVSEEEARRRAEAEANAAQEAQARANAEEQQKAAQEQAQRQQAAAEQSEREKQELRARLLDQFNRVLPTTDTARGLVVNMGDVLFDTGKADLRPQAREALAKLSGIVLNYPSLHLTVEGHTDNTGSAEFNQVLSEKRADGVRDYLVAQGLKPDSLSAQGFGMNNPIADNSTAVGRQLNRRVEIIVSGEVIGTPIGNRTPAQ